MKLPTTETRVLVRTRDKSTQHEQIEPALAFVTDKGEWLYDTSIIDEQLPPLFVENPETVVVQWYPLPK